MSIRSLAAPVRGRTRRWRVAGAFLAFLVLLAVVRVATIQPRTARPYLQGSRALVLAHQGASGHAPTSTLASFQLGMAQGADIIELDVHTTRDGVVVVSHDETIDRMSNGKGFIKSLTLAELRQYDFGYGFTPDGGASFPYRGKNLPIPTLEEIFQAFPEVRVNIEIKQVDPPMEQPVWDLIQKYGMADKVLIGSFPSEPGKRWAELTGGRTATGANKGHMYEFVAYYLLHLDWLYNPRVDAFQLPVAERLGPVEIRFDTPRLIERAHKLGIKVHYWTINDEATMRRLIGLKADGIITDFPDRAVKVLTEMGLVQ